MRLTTPNDYSTPTELRIPYAMLRDTFQAVLEKEGMLRDHAHAMRVAVRRRLA